MTTDDTPIGRPVDNGAGAPDGVDQSDLDALTGLLADPAVWAQPSAGLEARVVAAITAEATATPTRPATVHPGQVPAHTRRTVRRRLLVLAAVAAAGVSVLAVAGRTGDGHVRVARFEVAMAAAGAPGPTGTATVTRTDAGWEVALDTTGLPRLDAGRYYQAWMRDAAGVLVPLGSFNGSGRVTLWAGVSPADFPTLTVTAEAADGNQGSSGVRVLAGTAHRSPPR